VRNQLVDKAKDLKLSYGGHDSERHGKILGQCFSCCDEDAATFKKGVKRSWETHARNIHDKRKRLRDTNWTTLTDIVAVAHPGESRAKLRMITVERLQLGAVTLARALSRENPLTRRRPLTS